jgi:hypothetical protein
MNNIADKFNPVELDELSKLASLNGILKKKRDPGIQAKFSPSNEKFFRFFGYGRYLVYFNTKIPNPEDKPSNIILMEEIMRVEPNYLSKPTHFNIKLRGDKNLHLKAETAELAAKWVLHLDKIGRYFLGKVFLDSDPHRKWKEPVGPMVESLIMEQIEAENPDLVTDKSDEIEQAIRAKDMDSSLRDIGEKTRKSRFYFGFVSHCMTLKSDGIQAPDDLTNPNVVAAVNNVVDGITKTATSFLKVGVNFVLPTNIFWNKRFCVMSTAKNFVWPYTDLGNRWCRE